MGEERRSAPIVALGGHRTARSGPRSAASAPGRLAAEGAVPSAWRVWLALAAALLALLVLLLAGGGRRDLVAAGARNPARGANPIERVCSGFSDLFAAYLASRDRRAD